MTNQQIKYVINTFSQAFHVDNAAIQYGTAGNSKLIIKMSNTDFFTTKKELHPDKVIWKTWNGKNIPFLFDENDTQIIESSEGSVKINFDIIASAFYFLSGWQEHASEKKDNINRFPYAESIQFKLGIITLPVVNYYFDILKTAYEMAYNVKLKPNNWQGHDFAVCSTHDIDVCQRAWIEGSLNEIKRGRIFSPFSLIYKRIFKEDEWFNFKKILEIEKKFNVRSTFYFLSYHKKRENLINADFDIRDKKFIQVLDSIIEYGSEIGIHGSSGTHNNPQNFEADLKTLGRPVTGNRFHYLQFETDKTPALLENAGIQHDSTLYFAEHIGFHNSYCLPFRIYDIINDRPTNVWEVPLNVMDGTLSRAKYMNITRESAKEKVFDLIMEIKKFNGCFTLLWHNNYFSDYKYSGWQNFFIEVINFCKNENAYFGS